MSILDLKTLGPGRLYIYRKGSLSGPKADRSGIWTCEDGKYYAACARCDSINHFTNPIGGRLQFTRTEIYANVSSCIVCTHCAAHFFITIGDFPFKLDRAQQKLVRTSRRTLGNSLIYGSIPNITRDGCWRTDFNVYSKTGWGASIVKYLGIFQVISQGNNRTFETPDLESAIKTLVERFREHEGQRSLERRG